LIRDTQRPDADARHNMARIIRKASLYTYAFLAAGLAVALGGSALLAFLLHRAGLPFKPTWIGLSIIVLLPPAVMFVWRAVRDRR